MAKDSEANERSLDPSSPGDGAPLEAGRRPGEHPTIRRSGVVGTPVAITIATGLALAALIYVAVVAGIIG